MNTPKELKRIDALEELIDPPISPLCRLAAVPGSPSVASRYGWTDQNRSKKFDSWEAEIAHVESLGYTLVPPEYHIPHWSAQFSKDGPPPKLYVLRNDGPDEMRSSFDCPAARLGYPVFFKANASVEAPNA